MKTDKAFLSALCGAWLMVLCVGALLFGRTGFYSATLLATAHLAYAVSRREAPKLIPARIRKNHPRR